MPIHKYYAVIEPEENVFIVTFPDLENVFTQGDNLIHAVEMAQDVLGLMF